MHAKIDKFLYENTLLKCIKHALIFQKYAKKKLKMSFFLNNNLYHYSYQSLK